MGPPEGMKRSLMRLHDDDQESDITIKADDQEWKVHSFVLLMHSPSLHRAASESQESTVHLRNVERAHAAALKQFLYRLDYEAGQERPLTFHVHMYKLAHKYIISDLKALAIRKVQQMDRPTTLDFVHAVRELYDGWRLHYADMKKSLSLLALRGEVEYSKLEELFTIADFAYDVFLCGHDEIGELSDQPAEFQKYKHCQPFTAKFPKQDQDSENDAKDKPAEGQYRNRTQFACPYCHVKLSLAVWEDHLVVKEKD